MRAVVMRVETVLIRRRRCSGHDLPVAPINRAVSPSSSWVARGNAQTLGDFAGSAELPRVVHPHRAWRKPSRRSRTPRTTARRCRTLGCGGFCGNCASEVPRRGRRASSLRPRGGGLPRLAADAVDADPQARGVPRGHAHRAQQSSGAAHPSGRADHRAGREGAARGRRAREDGAAGPRPLRRPVPPRHHSDHRALSVATHPAAHPRAVPRARDPTGRGADLRDHAELPPASSTRSSSRSPSRTTAWCGAALRRALLRRGRRSRLRGAQDRTGCRARGCRGPASGDATACAIRPWTCAGRRGGEHELLRDASRPFATW